MTRIDKTALDYLLQVAEESGFQPIAVTTSESQDTQPLVMITLRQTADSARRNEVAALDDIPQRIADAVERSLASTGIVQPKTAAQKNPLQSRTLDE